MVHNGVMNEVLRSLMRGIAVGWLIAVLTLAAVMLRGLGAGDPAPSSPGLLAFPVPDAPRVVLDDGFGEARGDRRHEAVDIPAPRGSRVVAVSDGIVARLGQGGEAGLSIDLLGAAGRHCFFYAHLDERSAGLVEGARVERGQELGRVGTTGNAAQDAPHLHFAVRRLSPGQGCWEGYPVDPAPLLR
jgi:murein DD-endopeptidase MepM/ murein hydrolase activator NlpD